METLEPLQSSEATEETVPVCAGCGQSLTEHSGKSAICNTCRDYYIKYPIPSWIKAFGGGIFIILLFALISLPKSLGTGVHFKRGTIAAEKRNYLTAQKEFAEVVKKQPSFIEAKCQLLIAAFYNGDYAEMLNTSKELSGKNIENEKLYNEANSLMEVAGTYFPSDSFSHYVEQSGVREGSLSEKAYYTYLNGSKADLYANIQFVSLLYDEHKYNTGDSILNNVLTIDPTYYHALTLKIAIKRELGEFDSSLHYADRLLAINHEYPYAFAAKTKTLLKQKRDTEALAMAKKAYSLDANDGYVLASLALAYHFNNNTKMRDEMMVVAEKDSATLPIIAGIKDIISGKEKFRN